MFIDRDEIQERLIKLTLEILYLLTGEDYGPMKKSDDHVTSNNCPLVSKRQSRSQNPIMGSPPPYLTPKRNNVKKILEVTQKIIDLLTGEVPIRCQDVTVYFSMEEWEYLEGHKDLYKMENLQTITSPGSTEDSKPTSNFLEKKPVVCEEHLPRPDIPNLAGCKTSTSTGRKEQLVSSEEHLPYFGSSTQPTNTGPVLTPIKDEHFSLEEGECPPNPNQVKKDPFAAGEHHPNLDVFTHIYQPQCAEIKDEPLLCEEGAPCPSTSTPPHHTHCSPNQVKENPITAREHFPNPIVSTPIHQLLCAEIKDEPLIHGGSPHASTSTSPNHTHCPSNQVKEDAHSAREHLPTTDVSTHMYQVQCAEIKEEPFCEGGSGMSMATHNIKEEPLSGDEEDFTVTTFIVEDTHCISPNNKDFGDFDESLQSTESGVICSMCGKSFRYKVELLAHHRVHTGEKPFVCADCGKCFSSKSNLVTHRRSHTGERPYTCEECGKGFISSSNLIIHRRIHTGQKPYSCSVCGKTFNNSSYLSRHERAHNKETEYSCSECGKCFKYGTSFEKHKKSHGKGKVYPCPICGKCFSRSSILAVHQRTHTGERPFSCQICGKTFVVRSHLVVHQRIHSGEKPYSCSMCEKSFVSSSELRIHQKYHMEEKPFSCPLCGKGFVCNSALIRHERVHTRESPFSCPICGRSYRNKSDFVRHARTHGDAIVLK